MKQYKLKLAFLLFILGFTGILSMLTMDIPLPEEAKAILEEQFTPSQIKWLVLVNPTIMLIGAIVLGTFLYDRSGLSLPVFEAVLKKQPLQGGIRLLNAGVTYGILAGLLLLTTSQFFEPLLPQEFLELGAKLQPTLAARFLYGGITEEILMRFGLMTFLVFLLSKISRTLTSTIYWIAIAIAALLFAVGHFPIAYSVVDSPSSTLLIYILIGNTIGGLIFGWLYWKRGLEAAFLGHIFAHIVMMVGEIALA
ncbi:MAG: abortive infection protein [marine bacterium B5-7]|nr:MAG: abortive infection protein [marine bacterium B5-7]